MYAIIKTGGKQYRVAVGDVITVEKLNVEAGQDVAFDQVLAIGEGADLKLGTPFVEGIAVKGKVIENGKGEKVIIFKQKPKKDYRKKQGHRQPYTMVEITAVGDQVAAPKVEAKVEAEAVEVKETASDDIDLSTLKKAELLEVAAERGIKVSASAKKDVIIEAIKAESK